MTKHLTAREAHARSPLYFAYGSNLSLPQMARRCPGATALCDAWLPGWDLTFRGVADIVPDGSGCHGGLWRLTLPCFHALDTYEGFPHLYRREIATVYPGTDDLGEGVEAWVYVMNPGTNEHAPWASYLQGIEGGYRDFGLPLEYLQGAVDRSARTERLEGTDGESLRAAKATRHARNQRRRAAPRRPRRERHGIADWLIGEDARFEAHQMDLAAARRYRKWRQG